MAGYPQEGQLFGKYRIQRLVGRGGMGVVYAAVQENLGREVALKVLGADLADEQEFVERFTREATALARLDSPHVIHVYDHGEEDGMLYIATQFVPEGDFGQMLHQHGPAAPAQALELIGQVATGLQHAHEAGLIHRDIKPANVLIRNRGGEATAYLSDFGIVRTNDTQLTRAGGAIGTPAYMAPEIHTGQQASVASDIYSMGCLLWAALTGHAPYNGTSEYQIISAHMSAAIPSVPGNDPLARELSRVLSVAMAKDPGQRYRTARDLRLDLQRIAPLAAGRPVIGGLGSAGGPGGPSGGSHPSAGSHPSGSQGSGPRPGMPGVPVGQGSGPQGGFNSGNQPAAFAAAGPGQSSGGHSGGHSGGGFPPPGQHRPAPQPGRKSNSGMIFAIIGIAALVLAIGGLLFVLLSGTSEDEQKAIDSLAADLKDDNDAEGLDTDCIAKELVGSAGTDKLVDTGYLEDDMTSTGKISEDEKPDEDVKDDFVNATAACWSWEAVMSGGDENPSDDEKEQAACMEDEVSDDQLRDYLELSFEDDEPDMDDDRAKPVTEAAQECAS